MSSPTSPSTAPLSSSIPTSSLTPPTSTPPLTTVTSASTSATSNASTSSIFSSSTIPTTFTTSADATLPSPSTRSATTVIITSTAPAPTTDSPLATSGGITTAISSTASSQSPPTSTSTSSGGLSAAGTIAVAVVVPVVSVALIIIALLFWWRKRKARKIAEEERKQEIEDYRFNPNDATLPAVGVAGNYDHASEMKHGNNSGYRGWGATSNSRKLSNNMSGVGGPGMPVSDNGNNPGYAPPDSPTRDTVPYPEGELPPELDGEEPIGALNSTLPFSSSNRPERDIRRGPSNASSAYSAGNRSDASEDIPLPGVPPAQYYEESTYYNDAPPQQGPYADSYTYSGGMQPVIRDVQARRNTRIESPSVFPQQGNAGIAQNF